MKPHLFVLVALFHLTPSADGSPFDNGVDRVSVDSSGVEVNNLCSKPTISSDGRFVAFESYATNLVAGDTNGEPDVFLHDRQTGSTVRVSTSSGGTQANDSSYDPVISANGRYIAFESLATNLVAGDTNGSDDIFVHDRITRFTIRVSVTTSGAEADSHCRNPAISSDGSIVAFASTATNLHVLGNAGHSQVYVRDTVANRTTLCSAAAFQLPGNDDSVDPDVSGDGNWIVFQSNATNLTLASSPGLWNIYLFELASGNMSLLSRRDFSGALADDSSFDPVISADGNWVAFISRATNLIAGGTLGELQVFLRDISSGSNRIVSVSTSGNHGNNVSTNPSISGDGKRVAFDSHADNLTPWDASSHEDAFIHDLITGTTVCMTRYPDGQQGTEAVYSAIAEGGDFLAFTSFGTGFVADDNNETRDVFVRDYGALSRHAGPNPASYAASRPVLGEEWRASVDLGTTGHTFAVLYGKLAPANVTLGGGQRLLIGGPTIFKFAAQPGPVVNWSGLLPSDPALAGQRLYTQAVHLFGVTPFALSNAQDLCLGY